MIDTDDFDRALRAAFADTADREASFDDPAPRVSRRVTHRRRRRVATRVSAVVVVGALAAGTVGGLYLATRRSDTPAFSPTTPPRTPSVFRMPQTSTDRPAPAQLAGDSPLKDDVAAVEPASLRLLQSQPNVWLYGGRDHDGLFCVILAVVNVNGGGSFSSTCNEGRIDRHTIEESTRLFALKGAADSTGMPPGVSAVGFLVPDGIRTVTIDGTPHAVTRNSVLVVANHFINLAMNKATRHGSTLRVSSY